MLARGYPALLNHGEAVKVALLVRGGMGFQGFDDEPLVGMGLAYLSPEHVISFSSAPLRLWEHSRCVGILAYPSYATHLRQRCFRLGKPEGHVHDTIHLDSCRQRGPSLLPLASRSIQGAEVPVADRKST